AVDHDIAEIDADTELDAPLAPHIGIEDGHALLNAQCAANRIHHAGELDEQAVADRLHQATAMLGNRGIDQVAPQCSETSQPAFLIQPRQAPSSPASRTPMPSCRGAS